jgi:hypothetical protein
VAYSCEHGNEPSGSLKDKKNSAHGIVSSQSSI